MTRRALLSLVAVPFAIACGSQGGAPNEGPSTLRGSVALTAYALDNPVVVARGARGAAFLAPVQRDGSFRLELPSDDRYHVVLASTRVDGSYVAVSDLRWGSEHASWGRFARGGMTVDLGTVKPLGATVGGALRTSSKGSSSDCDCEDDDSSGSGSGSGSDDVAADVGDDTCYAPGKADLPYNVKPGVGTTFTLVDVFLVKGPPPAAILDVTMESPEWHLQELRTNAPITVTQADCDHEGNKGKGRDRAFVTWRNADGSVETDHFEIRYCDDDSYDRAKIGSAAPGGGGATTTKPICPSESGPVCNGGATGSSDCTGDSLVPDSSPADEMPPCAPPSGAATGSGSTASAGNDGATSGDASGGGAAGGGGTATGGTDGATSGGGGAGGLGDACTTNANCGAGLACYASRCGLVVN